MNSLPSFSASQRFRVSIVLLSLIPLLIPFIFLQSGSFFKYQTKVDDQIGEIEPEDVDRADKSINIWFQAVDFNPETQKAKFNVYPWPSEDLTTISFSSSTITNVPFSLFIDELNGVGQYEFQEN